MGTNQDGLETIDMLQSRKSLYTVGSESWRSRQKQGEFDIGFDRIREEDLPISLSHEAGRQLGERHDYVDCRVALEISKDAMHRSGTSNANAAARGVQGSRVILASKPRPCKEFPVVSFRASFSSGAT